LSGGPVTAVSVTGLKGLAGIGAFATAFVVSVSMIAQNVGTLPQTAFATSPSTVGSVSSLSQSRSPMVLGADAFGTSQIVVRMPNFTSPGVAQNLGATYGMQLVSAFPAFGRYVFNLPSIQVDPGVSSDTAIVTFPPRATPAEINAYIAANNLTIKSWYLQRNLDGDPNPGRVALVALPQIRPQLIDAERGLWRAKLPANLDAAALRSWATSSGIQIVGYDQSTGALTIQGPAMPAPVVRTVPVQVVHRVTTPTTPAAPTTSNLYVAFSPDTTVDQARTLIEQVGGQMASFDTATQVAKLSVAADHTTVVPTLLSAMPQVRCVNATAAA